MYIEKKKKKVSFHCEQVVNIILENNLVLKTCGRLHCGLYLSWPPSFLILQLLMEKHIT